MLELIIIIIIVWAIVRSKKKKKRQTGNAKHLAQSDSVKNNGTSGKYNTAHASSAATTPHTKKSMPKPSPVNQAKQAAKAAGRTREENMVRKATAGKYSTPRSDLRSGIRHEEWQAVPNGYTVRRCVYCAAENAIPSNDDPKKYRCYFCHVQL